MSRVSVLLLCLPPAWTVPVSGDALDFYSTPLPAPVPAGQDFSQQLADWASSPTLAPESVTPPLESMGLTNSQANSDSASSSTLLPQSAVGAPLDNGEAPACSRPRGWCTGVASFRDDLDCDGDGIPDPQCSLDSKTSVLGSASACAETWPSGVCGQAAVSDATKCVHGHWDAIKDICECYPGWAHSRVTDTGNFVKGVCRQFQCDTDEHCQRELEPLGIRKSTCPVKGWNCYCGWAYISKETSQEQGGAECMGPMFTLCIWMSETMWWMLSWMWMPIGALAILLLPFGRTRTVCDHHWPSLLNSLRKCVGREPQCFGRCLTTTGYAMGTFKDDIAWSLYTVELGIWVHLFLITTYFMALATWTMLLWSAVILALFLGCLMAICAPLLTCCGGCAVAGGAGDGGGGGALDFGTSAGTFAADGGGGGALDCCCSCQLGGDCCAETCLICCAPGHHGCGDCCCGCLDFMCCNYGYGASPAQGYYGAPDPLFWSSPNIDGSNCRCDCCDKCSCCRPLANLLLVFPVMPENALGGLFGFLILGTHSHTPAGCLYRGGNPFVELLRMRGARRYTDMHGDRAWRTQVHSFLTGSGEHAADDAAVPRTNTQSVALPGDRHGERIGRSYIVHVNRAFNKRDRCVPSSFEDYAKNECWCCQDSFPEWHHWETCGHLLCKRCSTEVLTRQMPCPLCRRTSLRVIEGKSIDGGGDEEGSTAATTSSDSEGEEGTCLLRWFR